MSFDNRLDRGPDARNLTRQSIPMWARDLAAEYSSRLRPVGGDPLRFEDAVENAVTASRRSRPPTADVNEQLHARPIRSTPSAYTLDVGPRIQRGPAWSVEPVAGRKPPRNEVANYLRDAADTFGEHVRRGGKGVERVIGGATSFLTKDQAGTAERDPLGALAEVGGNALGAIFDPFLEAGRRAIVTNDPTLNRRFLELGGGEGAAGQVIDELRTAAKNRAEDTTLPEGERFDAAGIATMLGIYGAGELGAPQVLEGITRLGAAGVKKILASEARTAAGRSRIIADATGRGFTVEHPSGLSETGRPRGNLGPPGEYAVDATGAGELGAGRMRGTTVRDVTPTPPVRGIPAWATSGLTENVMRTGGRSVATADDVYRLEDMFAARQSAGYYANKPAELARDMATLARLRRVAGIEGSEIPLGHEAISIARAGRETAELPESVTDITSMSGFGGATGRTARFNTGPRDAEADAARARRMGQPDGAGDERLAPDQLAEKYYEWGRRTAVGKSKKFPYQVQEQFGEDLVSEGLVGLVDAARKWKPGKVPFPAYAQLRIEGAQRDYLRSQDVLSRTERDVAQATGDAAAGQMTSLDAPLGPAEESGTLGDVIAAKDVVLGLEPAHPAYKAVAGLLEGLSEQERKVFSLRYEQEQTLMETARALGMSESGISRVGTRLEKKLLAAINQSEEPVLKEFLELMERRAAAQAAAQGRSAKAVEAQTAKEAGDVGMVTRRRGEVPAAPQAARGAQPSAPEGAAAARASGGKPVPEGRGFRRELPYPWEKVRERLVTFTPEQQQIIAAYFTEKASQAAIAQRFGTSQATISVLTRKFRELVDRYPPGAGDVGEYGGAGDVAGPGKRPDMEPDELEGIMREDADTEGDMQLVDEYSAKDFVESGYPMPNFPENSGRSGWVTPGGTIYAGVSQRTHHEDMIEDFLGRANVEPTLPGPGGEVPDSVEWAMSKGFIRVATMPSEVSLQWYGPPTEAAERAMLAIGAQAERQGKAVTAEQYTQGIPVADHRGRNLEQLRNMIAAQRVGAVTDALEPGVPESEYLITQMSGFGGRLGRGARFKEGGDGSPRNTPSGEQAMEARVAALAARYGFKDWADAANAIGRVRAEEGNASDVAVVGKMPRPVQDQILAHAEYAGKPLRDEGTLLKELETARKQHDDAEREWRRLSKRKTRTVYSKDKQRKVTYRGASQASVDFQMNLARELADRIEQLTAELTYGREVRELGPTEQAVVDSASRVSAQAAPDTAPHTGRPDKPEAPIEARRRMNFAAGKAAGKLEAVEELRARIQQHADELARSLADTDEKVTVNARKVAAALKQIASDNEATLPRLQIGKKGAKTKNTSAYQRAYAREVEPYLALRKNITETLDQLRDIEKGGLLEWAGMSVSQQLEKLHADHPHLELDEFIRQIAVTGDPFERQQLVKDVNDYVSRYSEWEKAGGEHPGEIPFSAPPEYPVIGGDSSAVRELKARRDQLLADMQEYLRQAEDLGVDQGIVDPVYRATSDALQRIKSLEEDLAALERDAGVPVTVGPEAEYVGSLNLDYIADPLARAAIRANYLRHAEAIEEATKRMTTEELSQNANDLANMVGGDPRQILEFVVTRLPRRGDVSKYIYLTRTTMMDVVLEMRRLAERNIRDERWDKTLATFDGFIMALNPAVSEAGRTLRFQQLIVGEQGRKAAELEAPIRTAELLENEKNRDWRKAVQEAEQAAQRALAERAKAEALRNPLADARAREAEAAAQKAQERADQLKLAYDRVEMARIAAEERRRAARMQVLTDGLIQARKRGATPDQLRELASMDPDRDFQAIVNFLRNIEPASGGEKFTAFVLNNMYSGMRANESNLLGNAFQLGRFLMLDPVAARTTAPLIARVTGREQSIVPQEFRFSLMALQHGVPRALRNFLNILSRGRGAADITEEIPAGSKFELGAPDTFPGPWGLLAEGALRVLSGVDAAFFHLSYVMEYDTMLARLAVASGAKTHAEVVDRMVDFIITPPEGMQQFAGKTAAEMTYRQELDRFTDAVVRLVSTPVPLPERIPIPGRLADFERANDLLRVAQTPEQVAAAQQLYQESSIGFLGDTPMFKWFLTPIMFTANAAKTALQFGGGGALTAPYHAWRTGRLLKMGKVTDAQALYMDRVASRTGLVGIAGALMLADAIIAFTQGDLTGEGPADPEANRIWRRTHQPFSRRVGGEWHRYDTLWPVGAAYTFVARVGEAIQAGQLKEEDAFELTVRGAGAFGMSLLDQPFLRNTAGFYDFFDGLARGGIDRAKEQYAATVARKFEWYSAFWNDLSRTLDPYERDPQTFLEFIEAKLPLISQSVRTRLDRWGVDVPQKPTGAGYLLPGAGAAPAVDAVDDEVTRLESIRVEGKPLLQQVSFTDKKIGDVELTPDEAHFYQQQAGQLAHRELDVLMQTQSWRGWNDEKRAQEVRKTVNAAREEARRAVANKLMGVVEGPGGTLVQFTDTGPEDRARGLVIGLSTAGSKYDRVKLMEGWLPAFENDPQLVGEFEKHKGADEWSVQDYREVAPRLKWMEEQPEFADDTGKPIGDEAQWAQYHAEYKEWRKVDRESGPIASRLYFLSKPILQVFDKLAHRTGGKNPRVTIAKLSDLRLRQITLPRDEEVP